MFLLLSIFFSPWINQSFPWSRIVWILAFSHKSAPSLLRFLSQNGRGALQGRRIFWIVLVDRYVEWKAARLFRSSHSGFLRYFLYRTGIRYLRRFWRNANFRPLFETDRKLMRHACKQKEPCLDFCSSSLCRIWSLSSAVRSFGISKKAEWVILKDATCFGNLFFNKFTQANKRPAN